MKIIGLIGGLGPGTTVDYYKQIIAAFNTSHADLAQPEIIIYSADINKLRALVQTEGWQELSAWLLEKIHSLHRAGADFAAIASNTPHIVFDEVKAKSPIPLLSIVETTCQEASNMALKNIGLMGTRLTMESDFYKKPFISMGMSIVVPTDEEQQFIDDKIVSEIGLGIYKESTKEELLHIAKRMMDEDGTDSLILGCTELPLLLPESKYGIPFLNTTRIHCKSILAYSMD